MKIGTKVNFKFQGKWRTGRYPNIGKLIRQDKHGYIVQTPGGAKYNLALDAVRPKYIEEMEI